MYIGTFSRPAGAIFSMHTTPSVLLLVPGSGTVPVDTPGVYYFFAFAQPGSNGDGPCEIGVSVKAETAIFADCQLKCLLNASLPNCFLCVGRRYNARSVFQGWGPKLQYQVPRGFL